MSATWRVLLTEDHTLVRSGVRVLLEAAPGFQVVEEAADGREAVKLAAKLQPDVVVMDIAMPKLNGIEATRQIKAATPAVQVLILSMHSDRQYVFECLRAGAGGYLLKDAATAELVLAVQTVSAGRRYLSRAVEGVVLDDYLRLASGDGTSDAAAKLSGREREILQLIAEGKTSPQIGRCLHISASTVDTHRRNIMEKLDIHNLVDLVKFALRHGLSTLE